MKLVFKKKYLMLIAVLFVGIFSFLVINKKGKNESVIKNSKGLKEYNYVEVQDGDDDIVGSEKVKFDAYLLKANENSNNADKYRGATISVSSNAKLWIDLKIHGDETLKDAYIEFTNKNVRLEGAIAKSDVIAETIVSNNVTRIPLNEISTGTTKLFYLTVEPDLPNNINSYNATNKVTLKGTVVKDGVETQIEKVVEYEINFYGDENAMRTEIESKKTSAPMIPYGSDDAVTVTYTFRVNETKDLMMLKSANIEAYIGKLNGFDPISVSLDANGFEYNYDAATNTLTATREAEVTNNRITKNAYAYQETASGSYGNSYYSVDSSTGISKANGGTYSDPNNRNKSSFINVNNLTLTVVYPNEASLKTGTATVNLTAWYEGFNNENLTDAVTSSEKVSRRLIANYQCDDTKGTISTLFTTVKINRDTTPIDEQSIIDSTNIANTYNGVESDNVKYDIDISPYVGGYNPAYPIGTFTIYDLGNNLMNGTSSMKEYEKYYSISLSNNVFNYLGAQGGIKVIDADTNEVLHVFTSSDALTYKFDKDVRSIRLEGTDIDDEKILKAGINNSLFTIKLTKEIDNDYVVNNVSHDVYETWNYVQTQIRTDWTAGEYSSVIDTEDLANAVGKKVQRVSALFTEGYSRADFKVDATDTNNQLEVKIDTKEITRLYKGYKDGVFIIEMPDAILDYDVVENNLDYEKLEINGKKLLKIKKTNDRPERYQITFHLDVIPDVRVVNQTVTFKLYVYNPNCHNYMSILDDIYDINSNGNTDEYVGAETSSMNLIAPSEVITAAMLENYNTKQEISVSPMIAEVDPVNDTGDGKVSILVINNSGYAIKDIKVMGKIAFVGNKNQINGEDLDSEFNTQMTSAGIKVPDELVGSTTVYYSENENPSDDLSNNANGWTETPADFSNVKSYMILISDYEIANQANVTFEYNITMPTDTDNLFKKAYFTHAVYFNVVTEAGLVDTSAGSTKLGITMVRKYDLNIDTLRKGTTKDVDYVLYEIEDEDGNVKTILPTSTGIEAKGLYVGKEYKLRQKYISTNYEIDEEEKTFEIINGLNDELEITTEGVYKEAILNNSVLNVTIENYPRYTVVLKNTDFDTDANISGSKFKITGKGYESGYTTMTNVNGELTFNNLYLNETYTLQQMSAPKYQSEANTYSVRLGYDDQTGEVKIYVKAPRYSNPVNMTDAVGATFSFESNAVEGINIISNSTNSSEIAKSYVELDLTNYSGTYRAEITSYGNVGYLEIFLTNYYVSSIDSLPTAARIINYNQNSSYGSATNYYIRNAYTSNGSTISITGGNKYYFYVNQYKNDATVGELSPIKFIIYGNEEYDKLDETSYAFDKDVSETVVDNLSNNQPIVNVNVKNKIIPTTKLKVTKKDADTGALLPNAMYRLEGPGIVDSLIFTTDENGVFETDIYYYYDGSYRLAGYTYQSSSNGDYTLKEIQAPSGYAVDSKEYKFRVRDNITCPTGETCTKDNAIHKFEAYYYDNDYSFDDASYDETTGSFNVSVYDYPLVKITKKDKDTGELLPNTMFAIYKVTKVNGRETIGEALDINGNPIGEEMVIDGETYRVITTDQNGSITLNLEKGQYKLKEVQASSDKYDISKQTYYFGVGETVPYQAEGMNFVKAYNLENASSQSIKMYQTNDGGYIYFSNNGLTKVDKNDNVVWTKPISSTTCFANVDVTLNYPDKASAVYNACIKLSMDKVFTTSSGEIILTGWHTVDLSYEDPANPGTTISYSTSVPFIRLNSDGTLSSKYKLSIDYVGRKAATVATNRYNETDNPDEIYYSIQYGSNQVTWANYKINGFDYTNVFNEYMQADYQKDYEINSAGEMFILYGAYFNKSALFKFGANGDYVGYTMIDSDLKTYFNDQNLGFNLRTGDGKSFGKIKFDVDGNIMFTGNLGRNASNSSVLTIGVIKYKTNLTLLSAKPVVYNSTNYPKASYARDVKSFIEPKADGGYYIYAIDSMDCYGGNPTSIYNLTSDDYFNIPTQVCDTANLYVLEYDKDGKAVNAVNIGRRNVDNLYPETNKYVIKGIDYLSANSFLHIIPDGDGFIVSARYSFYTTGANYVILASGERVTITENFIIYRVNKDSRVEWLKQFSAPSEGYMYKDTNNKIKLVFNHPGIMYDENGDSFTDESKKVYIFEPSAEVLASGPEAYSLDIKNETKKFAITVNSDDGSTYSVKNSNGQEIFNGTGEYKAETVKYDNNSENEITVTLLPGHTLKNVTLNGKDFTYQVNSDGTITLDKIPSITEEKEINIVTEEKDYSVIVHHYLENTTDRIASDEILSGNYGEVYEAHPVVSNLYSLVQDENGNYIMPTNYTKEFQDATGDVIFYYKENEVELNVNYYVENTSDELKPTLRQRKLLGSRYSTEPAEIEFYNLTGVAGEENGILNQNLTTVSYFYQQVNESTITVKHLDINTGAEVAPTETLTVAKDSQYTTNVSTNIPANYEYVSRTSNAVDTATHENIEVIYYYKVTPFNVSVDKKIDKIRINGKDITISDSKLAKIEPNKGDEVIIYYEITLKNDGNIKAEFRVVEKDVDNFVIYDLGNFIEENGEYVLKETLEPGEEKTYKIGYKWEAGHYGKSKNKVEVTDVKNARGFSEPDALDNISETVVIINVPTGLKLKFTFVILAGIIVNGGLIMLFIKRGIRR